MKYNYVLDAVYIGYSYNAKVIMAANIIGPIPCKSSEGKRSFLMGAQPEYH